MASNQEDPVLTSARREALVVFACWLIAMTWSVSYCYLQGYISLESGPLQVEQQALNAARISDKKFVEVRPAAEGGTPELWVDRGRGSERVTFVLGFPSWVFWGVALPWWVCTAFALIFGAYIVRDEDLGLDPEQAAEAEGVAHV